MSKIKYFFLIVITLLCTATTLSSCSKDDNDDEEYSIPTSTSFYVGTWSVQSVEGWGLVVNDGFEYIQLKADGTCIDVADDEDEPKGYSVEYGTWTVANGKLIIKMTSSELAGTTITYDITKAETNKLTVSVWGITAYLTKVSDSVIEKYL